MHGTELCSRWACGVRSGALAVALVVGALAGSGLPVRRAEAIGSRPPASAAVPTACRSPRFAVGRADALLANRYRLGPFPEVRLPRDPSWSENPVHDVNWQVRLQGMTWMDSLLAAWTETHDARYARRVRFLVDDWLGDNPRSGPASGWAWYDQAVGVRASMFVCVLRVLGGWPALRGGLEAHGRALADPGFYVYEGNHALDQSIGLLDVGYALQRDDWMALARARMATLVTRSVSARGVTNEQAVGYQRYNLLHYGAAMARLTAYGLPVPVGFARVARMPVFLAHATLPDGAYVMIGDTEAYPVTSVPGTDAEYAATRGASGSMPSSTLALYRDEGWLFARTGWGRDRPFAAETMLTLRFGPGPRFHGHADGGSLTLYGDGSNLVLDPGKYSYNPSAFRTWFRGRGAHNVVMVDGVRLDGLPTRLVAARQTDRLVDATMVTEGTAAVTNRRRVLFSRRLGYVIVEDRLRSPIARRFRQQWHLRDGSRPVVTPAGVITRHGGRLLIVSLAGGTERITSGGTNPIGGWVSYRYGTRRPAPVVGIHKQGRSVRYLTLLVPGAAVPSAVVSDLSITRDGFSLSVTVGAVSERVTVDGGRATITDG